MSLGIYTLDSQGSYSKHSDDGSMSNPITTVHHGRDGDTIEKQLWIKSSNDNAYSNIQVKPVSISSDDDIGIGTYRGTSGWGVKLMEHPGHNPTEAEWDAVEYGAVCDIADDITSSNDARVFWCRIESPRGINVQNKNNIKFVILYTETPV